MEGYIILRLERHPWRSGYVERGGAEQLSATRNRG